MEPAIIFDWLLMALTVLGWLLLSVVVAFIVFALLAFFFIRRWVFRTLEHHTGENGFLGQVALPILGALLWIFGQRGQTRKNINDTAERIAGDKSKPTSNVERTIHDI